jgi:hypothetical protein
MCPRLLATLWQIFYMGSGVTGNSVANFLHGSEGIGNSLANVLHGIRGYWQPSDISSEGNGNFYKCHRVLITFQTSWQRVLDNLRRDICKRVASLTKKGPAFCNTSDELEKVKINIQ